MLTLPVTVASPPLPARKLNPRIFNGDYLLFSHLPAIRRFNTTVRNIVRDAFATNYPPQAHQQHQRDNFLCCAESAQQQVNTSDCKQLFADVLRNVGLSTEGLFWDTLGLRVAPPVNFHHGGFRSAVGVHRDTWGAGFQAQINWWAPLWPLAQNRTMGFYPRYWRQPLTNTTAEWSFKDYLKARQQAKNGRKAAYPSAPQALVVPDDKIIPLIMRPGQLFCFSAAHLHATIPNTSSLTRFNIEIRTLCLDDLQQNRGSPNTDNNSRHPLPGLFSAVNDNSPLKTYWQPTK
ncbi:hypothetical protein NQX30_04950 [Candidatus Persebacteraceae bacterium Df01]|jgi:hypothetical protein|uniref:Phytanoyl-CoA dioxygenase n=1 Tax=Candidatus Doriopsillibacter californiensis TaxID=2970740 RepID=A0ABT7QMA7_9GAMM|nr:hypothetical protein [Candidatus Persebacteraceae bacterium Df01]